MPGDYPDWMYGYDAQEGARRSVGGISGAHSGRVIYSNDFENGLGGLYVDLLDVDYVYCVTGCANNGNISLKMYGAAADTEGRNFSRNHSPAVVDRMGLELSLRSFYTAGQHYQEFIFGYYLYDYNTFGKTIGAIIKIVQSATLDGAVYIWGSTEVWIDTGIRLTKLFLEDSESYSNVGYHSIKLRADFREGERKYIDLIIDGVSYDLSSYDCVVIDTVNPIDAIYLYCSYTNKSANENYICVDDLILTDQEP